jgi:hypothetical protein
MQLKIAHIMVNGVLISVQVNDEQYEKLVESGALHDPSSEIASEPEGEPLETETPEDEPKSERKKNEPEPTEG